MSSEIKISHTCTMDKPNPGASICYECRAEHMTLSCPRHGGPPIGFLYLERERLKHEATGLYDEECDEELP